METTPQHDAHQVLQLSQRWVSEVVVGLNLCPFAGKVVKEGKLEWTVSPADNQDDLYTDFLKVLERIYLESPEVVETSLLVVPHCLADFEDYLDFLGEAEAAVEASGLEGTIQLASFHPRYQFADAAADDPANCTNRSPYPMIHFLREASVEEAIANHPDVDGIPARNIELLRSMDLSRLKIFEV